MAETAAPFDGGPYVEEVDWTELFAAAVPDGVYSRYAASESGHQQNLELFTDTDGRQVKVSPGVAHLRGHLYRNTDIVVLPIAANFSGYSRKDRVVVRLNQSPTTAGGVPGRSAQLYVIQGIPAFSPVVPDLSTGALGVYDLPIGVVTATNEFTTVITGNIERDRTFVDERKTTNNYVRGDNIMHGFVNNAGVELGGIGILSGVGGIAEADDITFSSNTTSNIFRFFVAGDQRVRIGGDGITAVESLLRVGTGVCDATGSAFTGVDINPFNVHVHFTAVGSGSSVGMRFLVKGTTSAFDFYGSTAGPDQMFAVIDQAGNVGGATETALAIRSENVLKRVYVSEPNTAGTGYRALRVLN